MVLSRTRQFAVILSIALASLLARAATAGVVYFQVAEFPQAVAHGDSFVLPLSGPADIQYARRLIAHDLSEPATIAVAQIAAGSDGINRDLLAPGQPLWSWHVTQFEGFAELTAEILDGWPDKVEENVDGWIDNTQSRIGFWNYTIVKELQDRRPMPIPLPGSLAGPIVMLVVVGGAIERTRSLSRLSR